MKLYSKGPIAFVLALTMAGCTSVGRRHCEITSSLHELGCEFNYTTNAGARACYQAMAPVLLSLQQDHERYFNRMSAVALRVAGTEPPLLYPRLIAPHLAEKTNGGWLIPVVLRRCSLDLGDLATNLAYFLFPRNTEASTQSWVQVWQATNCPNLDTNQAMVPKEGRATVLEASDAMLGPGLYDLRVFPQLRIAGCIPAGDLGQAMTNFAKGNWPSALKALKRVEAQRMRKTDGEGCAFGNLANALETLRHARFKKEMRRIADSARALV